VIQRKKTKIPKIKCDVHHLKGEREDEAYFSTEASCALSKGEKKENSRGTLLNYNGQSTPPVWGSRVFSPTKKESPNGGKKGILKRE